MLLKVILCLIIGYAFGCFSTAYVVGKLNNIDIRDYGSGNAGTTNAMRTLGKKAGILTFLGDALKAVVPLAILRFIVLQGQEDMMLLLLYTGIGIVLGHNFPFWLKFKGGKGIAVTGGVMLLIDWKLGLIAFVVFILVTLITKYVSLGSILLSLLMPIWMLIFYLGNLHMLILSLVYTGLAIYKHRANIERLIQGNENKIGQRISINKE